MSHLSQVVQTLPSDPSLNKIGPTICGYSSGCRLWASISRSFDHRRAQSECICKCVQIRFILTYGCKWVFSLVFTATSTVWLKNLYLNMLSWYDVRFNSKLTTGHFFVDHFVNTSSEESTRVSTLELFYSGNVICYSKYKKKKKIYLPTDPNFFFHVTGNTGIFLFGLIGFD